MKKRTIAIIGIGTGGKELLILLKDEKSVKIIGVCEKNKNAVGLKFANEAHIPIYFKIEDLINDPKNKSIDLLIDSSNNKKVAPILKRLKAPATEIIGGKSAHLLWSLAHKQNLEKEIYQALYEIDSLLSTKKNMPDLFELIIDEAKKRTNSSAGSLVLYDKNFEEFVVVRSSNVDYSGNKRWKRIKNGLTDKIIKSKAPVVIENTENESFLDKHKILDSNIKSLIGIRLVSHEASNKEIVNDEDIIGILFVDSITKRKYKQEHLFFLDKLSLSATIAIQKSQLMDRLNFTIYELNNLINSSPDAIIASDNKDKIIQFNPAANKMLFYDEEEIKGESAYKIYENLLEAASIDRKVGEKGGVCSNVRTRLRKKDKSLVDVLLSIVWLKDERNKIQKKVGFMKDISEIAQLEKELKKEQKELTIYTKGLTDIIKILIDSENYADIDELLLKFEGTFLCWEDVKKVEDIHLELNNTFDTKSCKVIDLNLFKSEIEEIKKFKKQNCRLSDNVFITSISSSKKIYALLVSEIIGDNQEIYLKLIQLNCLLLGKFFESRELIKEAKRLRDTMERRELAAIAGGISRKYAHEVINATKGLKLWRLKAEETSKPNYKKLENIIQTLSNYSTSLTRASMGAYKKKKCLFNTELENILNLLDYRNGVKVDGCKIKLDFASKQPRKVNIDPATFIGILHNLVGNAIEQYIIIGKGCGPIEISVLETYRDHDQYVGFKVKDYAGGIEESLREKIFEEGFSTKGDTLLNKLDNEIGGGTGIGLFIVKSLVEAGDGKIILTSNYGSYAEFAVIYPVCY